jgi:hypothetical protein
MILRALRNITPGDLAGAGCLCLLLWTLPLLSLLEVAP